MSEDRKKVLFFLPSSVGGAEKMSVNIAKMLDRSEYDPKFVIVGRKKEPIASLIPEGYPCSLLYVYRIWDFGVCKISRLLRKEKPYAVFSSIMYLNVRVILAAVHIGNIKIVIRNDSSLSLAQGYVRSLIRSIYPKADHIIVQQQEMGDELISVLPAEAACKIRVLQNPVDTLLIEQKLSGCVSPYPDDSSVNYVCVASISYIKGQDVLLKAFRELKKSLPSAKLYFVGACRDKGYIKTLEEYVEENDLMDSVTFVGYTTNPYSWIKYSDCFVLSSRIEGLPNVLIDAQYLGIPVVATRCVPVIARIIDQGRNGYSVENEDVCALARAMEDALDLKDVRMNYRPASREEFVELFH